MNERAHSCECIPLCVSPRVLPKRTGRDPTHKGRCSGLRAVAHPGVCTKETRAPFSVQGRRGVSRTRVKERKRLRARRGLFSSGGGTDAAGSTRSPIDGTYAFGRSNIHGGSMLLGLRLRCDRRDAANAVWCDLVVRPSRRVIRRFDDLSDANGVLSVLFDFSETNSMRRRVRPRLAERWH